MTRKLSRCFLYLLTALLVVVVFNMKLDLPTLKFNRRNDDTNNINNSRVILFAYMRSGSSLVGDVIQQDPDVFYVFEPLMMLGRFHNLKTPAIPLLYLDDYYVKKVKNLKAFQKLSERTVTSFLNCTFEKIDVSTLSTGYYSKSHSTKTYNRCLKANRGIIGLIDCLAQLQKRCTDSKLKLEKVIRLPMGTVAPMMTRDQKLKVIHLVRDPRAIFVSQVKMKKYKYGDASIFFGTFCQRMVDDLKMTIELAKLYGGRVRILSYEQMSENPIETTRSVYKFLDLNFTSAIHDYVWNVTSAGNEDKPSCAVCTSRANSFLTSQKWRNVISFDQARSIEDNCGSVLEVLGYKSIKNQNELRNLSYNLFEKAEIYNI